jgi:hypothetical protein
MAHQDIFKIVGLECFVHQFPEEILLDKGICYIAATIHIMGHWFRNPTKYMVYL